MNDHQITIGSDTRELKLIRDDGAAMYSVQTIVPQYTDDLRITQTDWTGGHGYYDFNGEDIYYEGESIDTTQEGKIFLGPLITEVKESDDSYLDSAVVGIQWFEKANKLLCWTAGKVYIYGTKWTAATTTLAGVTAMCEYNGVMYAAMGGSAKYYYSTDGDTWTVTDLTNGYADGFVVTPNPLATQDVLRLFKKPNEVRNTTDGRTVASGGEQWSSIAYIGDTTDDIMNMFYVGDKLMVGRQDNLYHYTNSGGVRENMGELKTSRNTNNFKYVTLWQTSAYASLGNNLAEFTSYNSYDSMGPLTEIGDIGKTGICVGLDADKDFIYAAYKEGSNYIIYKGFEKTYKGEPRWSWCPWVNLSTRVCAVIRVVQHSLTDRRLWFAYGGGVNHSTGYVTLTDNPTSDSSARFAPSGWIRMSYIYGTNQYFDKLFQSVITETENCAAERTVTPKYRKDTDTTASALTAAITTNGTVRTQLTNALTCKRIQFELHFASNDSSKTPVVKYFQAIGTEKPTVTRIHECTYSLGTNPFHRTSTLRSFFRAGLSSTSLIKFSDLRYNPKGTDGTAGTDYVYVVIPAGGLEEVEVMHEKGKQPELGLHVYLREVDFT